tara:strand:+ start:11848 stop:12462 length:615 start_codon:yes stop_codon:yes gene_type:complete
MLNSYKEECVECGIDEAGRGCLSGRVYTAAVILPTNYEVGDTDFMNIKDSKKLSKKKREELRIYIERVAISYAVDYGTVEEIDKYNILHTTLRSMHRAVDKLTVKPEHIAVDGNRFIMYMDSNDDIIEHTLITAGDNKYRNIAAASILAKTHHDEYVRTLLEEDPELQKYGWATNMCYGTKIHMEAIRKYGITKHHRRSFRPCR